MSLKSTKSKFRSSLRAGAAKADITPVKGIQIGGDIGRHRPVEQVRERIYARALVLEQGKKRCCILSLDLCLLFEPWTIEIRRRLQEQFGFEPGAVMVHTTQNHSAPSLGNDMMSDHYPVGPGEPVWLRGGDERYYEPALAGIVKAVGDACAALQPVKVQAGRGVDGRVSFNRRFVMRDGTGQTHPDLASPDILYGVGLIDPEVGVLSFVAKNGKPVALLLHHTLHPVHGFPHRYIIGDWPGAWVTEVQKRVGPDCIPLVLNGCCGDVHHRDHLNPQYKLDHRRVARLLAETTANVLERMEDIKAPRLSWNRTILRLPLRTIAAKEKAGVRRMVAKHPSPLWIDRKKTAVSWEWMYAVSVMDVLLQQKLKMDYRCEIQAFRLGNVVLLGLPGEPFVAGQLDIKLHSPARYTFVGHCCNDYAGYIPTRDAFLHGGYETRTANWSKLEPDALENIVRASGQLLKKLW